MTTITARHPVSGRILSVRFEVRDGPDGWKLWAVPATGSGWAPIPMTRVGRGTASGALVEFVDALFLNQDKAEGRHTGQVAGEADMGNIPKQFVSNFRLETRALAIEATLKVFAVSGKGHDSGYGQIKAGLEALGFRFVGNDDAVQAPPLPDLCTNCGGSGSLPDMTCCAVCGGGGRVAGRTT
jgi:hypothetical protein